MREAFAAGAVAVEIELLRRDVLDDRQVLRRRTKILSQGQDLAAHFAQIIHCLEKFRFRFAKPEHDAAFCDNLAAAGRKLFRPPQDSQ